MQLVVEDFELMAPVILNPSGGPMTDEAFVEFCRSYEDCQVESTAGGEIIIMPPNYSRTSIRNSAITGELYAWARADGRGEVLDSSGGFRLPNGARRAADAAWVRKDRIAALPAEQRRRFFPLCPDFVIELRSPTDRLNTLRAKMNEYISNGAELGWLIDPEERAVWIYRPGRDPERLDRPERVAGEGPVAGFVFELASIWA